MTKKPTGLTLTRDDNKFTRKWKRGASYNKGQQVGRRINAGTWSNTDVGSSVTSKAFDIDFTKYYPNTQTLINSVSFRVRGKKGSSWSAYATKTMTLQLTNEPVLTVTPDTSIANRCVFSWETETSNSGDKIFTDCEWQSILVPNCNVVDGEQLAWSGDNFTNGVGKATDSVTKDETIEISTGTHTRWFRVRSRGPRGNSNWVYGKRVYASPYQMVIQETSATKTDNGYQVYVKWSGNSNDAYPTDTLTIDYTMATPDPGMVCPAGASPTTAVTVAQQGETNAVSFAIDSYLGRDQALYARVNSVHNLTTTYGDWTLVSVGELSQPTLSGVTTDPTTHRATVTATNNSAVTDSFLAIVYRTASAPDDFAVLGVIPYGQTSATVQCPNWTGQTIQFGVYAVVGSYNATTRADGVGSYEISVIMKSGTVWQAGSMPDAPNEISVTATSVQGSVKVSWNWSWADANEAVISWADHEDAWESTSEPNEYTVSNVHASEWTIAGLETGKRWYIRVRLINTTADSAIYGPWSDMAVIDLSSAPSIPTLTLSSGIIPVDGSVSAYWSYVATDGTAQAYASVCEAFITNGGIIYGEPIAHVETAQHVTIYAEEQGWNEGETHYLCASVVSASGRVSDEWSDPVPVTIAEPLECTIAQTSLENEIIETNPREFSGDLVSFETEMEEDFTKLEVALSPIQEGTGDPSPSNVRPIYGHGGVTVYDSPTEDEEDAETYTQEFDVSLTPTSTDTDPYLFKAVGDIYGDRLEEDIVGGTVAWNQLCFERGTPKSDTLNGITWSISDDGSTVTANGTATANSYFRFMSFEGGSIPASHKLLLLRSQGNSDVLTEFAFKDADGNSLYDLTSTQINIVSFNKEITGTYCQTRVLNGTTVSNVKVTKPLLFDLTAMFGSEIADYIYSLEQANAGAGVAWLKSYGFFTKSYYEYDTGTLKSVIPTAHKMVGVNAWDEEWELGTINSTGDPTPSNATIRSKNFIRVLPNTIYYYKGTATAFFHFYDIDKNWISLTSRADGQTFVTPNNAYYVKFRLSGGTTYNNDICINISNTEVNGKYFPYEEHIYDLGNVPLYGLFQLENGKLKAYGDVRHAEGGTDRKFALVDLGTLNYTYVPTDSYATVPFFVAPLATKKGGSANMITEKYVVVGDRGLLQDKTIAPYNATNSQNITICDTAYTDATTFKSAMSGVYLVYEKATTTTEQTDPFTQIQEVSKYGTLEYITTNNVPVGHNTTYYTRDVFGGYIDLVSGQLVVNRRCKFFTANDVFYASSSGNNRFYCEEVPFDASKKAKRNTDSISSQYTPVPNAAQSSALTQDKEIAVYQGTGNYVEFYIRDSSFSTAQELNNYVASQAQANTPIQLVYYLENPLTYQLTPQQINTLLGVNNVWSDDGTLNIRIAESARNILALKEMPLTVTVTGAGEGGTTMLVIERAEDYHIDRPDNTDFNGYEGETIYSGVQAGESEIMINREDLIGSLDDGASYRLVATVQDGLGQADTKILEFEVDWAHQAIEPSGSVNMQDVALITPTKPNGWLAGDTVDIYRLSADRPELIVEGGEFGTVYVDPYPTIGQFGGYRLVYKTYDGDYITEDNNIAWLDIMAPLDVDYSIINFNGEELHLRLNLEITNQWQKNFKETKYLGGSVQGDWDKGYSRNGTLKGLVVFDPDTILQTKELAVWDGICHLRTPDGASFACNIEVSDDISYNSAGKAYAASLNITRVDSEELDGQEYSVWEYEEA